MSIADIFMKLWSDSGFSAIITGFFSNGGWQNLVMILIG